MMSDPHSVADRAHQRLGFIKKSVAPAPGGVKEALFSPARPAEITHGTKWTEPAHRDVTRLIGRHPRLPATELHAVRRDPHTGRVLARVPKMLYNVTQCRGHMAEHRVLEEDWRAYRAMVHNWLKAKRAIVDKSEAVKGSISSRMMNISVHRPGMENPAGYLYERYTADHKETSRPNNTPEPPEHVHPPVHDRLVPLSLPVLEIDDPFKKMHVTREHRTDVTFTRGYDVDVIYVPGMPERAMVYNEPDSVPLHLARENFSLPLVDRALRHTGQPLTDRHWPYTNLPALAPSRQLAQSPPPPPQVTTDTKRASRAKRKTVSSGSGSVR